MTEVHCVTFWIRQFQQTQNTTGVHNPETNVMDNQRIDLYEDLFKSYI